MYRKKDTLFYIYIYEHVLSYIDDDYNGAGMVYMISFNSMLD